MERDEVIARLMNYEREARQRGDEPEDFGDVLMSCAVEHWLEMGATEEDIYELIAELLEG